MPKREIDRIRTVELGQPELLVLKNSEDEDHYDCVLSVPPGRCPRCGRSLLRNQGNQSRNYLDIVRRYDYAAVVTLTVEFRKSKCLFSDCGCVFYPDISFASRYSRTTHRLENVILRMILEEGYSYSLIAYALDDKLSKQVIGQIYYRRMKELQSDPNQQPQWFREYLESDSNPFLRHFRYIPRRRMD